MNDSENISIIDFPEDSLSAIVKWRNDPEINKYLRPGYRSLEEVTEWYTGHYSSHGNRLFGIRREIHIPVKLE